MYKTRSTIRYRRCRGYIISEHAAMLVILILGFIFPFLDLATVGLRYAFLTMAVHDAAHVSSTCSTFSSGSSDSAVMDLVPPQIAYSLGTRWGFDNRVITVRVVAARVPDGMLAFSEPNLPFTGTVDTQNWVYTNEVTVKADLQPLISFSSPFLPGIPGISAPINVVVSAKEVSENPAGLAI
jgi:hypothetical protein